MYFKGSDHAVWTESGAWNYEKNNLKPKQLFLFNFNTMGDFEWEEPLF